MEQLKRIFMSDGIKDTVLGKQFVIILAAYTLSILTLLRANYSYIDDLGRIILGYRLWLNFSRYVSEFFSPVINGDYILNDISPLPQLLAVVFLAFSSVIIIKAFSLNKDNWLINSIAVLPLGFSPYFLECLSFKFDAPFMAFSVLTSVFPILFINHFRCKKYFLLVFICTMLMCMTYQASSGIFMLTTLVYLVCSWNQGETIQSCFKKFIVSAAGFLSSIIVYRQLLMTEVRGYVSTSVAGYDSFFCIVWHNLETYANLLLKDNIMLWKALFVLICIMYLRSFAESSSRKKCLSFLVGLIVLPLGMVLSFGGYIFLEKLSFFPRTMYGIGVFVAIIAVISVDHLPKNLMAKIASCAMSWVLFSFAFCYGNALAEQNHYDEFRTQLVLSDLSRIKGLWDSNQNRRIQIQGSTGYSPIVKRMVLRYGILGRLVPIKLQEEMPFGRYYPFYFFGLPNVEGELNWDDGYEKIDSTHMPILVDTCYHTIKADDKSIVVIVKKREGLFGDIEVTKDLG